MPCRGSGFGSARAAAGFSFFIQAWCPAELRGIGAAVDECLDRREGLLSHIIVSGTKFLLRWRQRTHPKKAIPGARRGRPRNEWVHKFMTEFKISRSTAYRVILE